MPVVIDVKSLPLMTAPNDDAPRTMPFARVETNAPSMTPC